MLCHAILQYSPIAETLISIRENFSNATAPYSAMFPKEANYSNVIEYYGGFSKCCRQRGLALNVL